MNLNEKKLNLDFEILCQTFWKVSNFKILNEIIERVRHTKFSKKTSRYFDILCQILEKVTNYFEIFSQNVEKISCYFDNVCLNSEILSQNVENISYYFDTVWLYFKILSQNVETV